MEDVSDQRSIYSYPPLVIIYISYIYYKYPNLSFLDHSIRDQNPPSFFVANVCSYVYITNTLVFPNDPPARATYGEYNLLSLDVSTDVLILHS